MFRNYLIMLEALRVVKKGTEVFSDSEIIGRFQNKDVIKTTHMSSFRGNDARDKNISNSEFIDILKRIKSSKKLENGYYNISYLSKINKYNVVVVYIDDKTIRFVTSIQHERDNPDYYTKPGDKSLVVESIMNIMRIDSTTLKLEEIIE